VKTRIYIVDDHALIRRGLTTLINGEPDMEVCGQAEDAATAVQDVIKFQPDLVTVDISLKGNSGLELIKSIRAFNPKIQILVLSMHHESIYALRVLKAGARAYIMKQDVISKVVEAIRRIRSGHLYVSDDVASQMLNRLVGGETGDDTSPVAMLSDRELEIVNLIGSGMLTREIAAKLHVSIKTVETHRAHIKEKLNLHNATQLVQFCVRWVEENKAGNEAIAAIG
jgi:DNA-binding NarL/FixJ family response regulator